MITTDEIIEAARALADKMPDGEALNHYFARDQVTALRNYLQQWDNEAKERETEAKAEAEDREKDL